MQGGSQANFWGKLVVELRQERGLSQRQLSANARVNRSTLRRIEEGKTHGDIRTIEAVLKEMDYELEAMHSDALTEKRLRELRQAEDPKLRSKAAASTLLVWSPLKSAHVCKFKRRRPLLERRPRRDECSHGLDTPL